jgi:toxin ParE1/3/4
VTGKPIIPRELAVRDVEACIDGYLAQDAAQAALGFVDALERAYTHIGAYPATGSARHAFELELPGLRSWPLARYPHLVS